MTNYLKAPNPPTTEATEELRSRVSEILKDIERDYYMTAEEAKAYGIVDEVITKENRTVNANSPITP